MIVQEYGIRQEYSEITGSPPNTEALDNFLVHQPWRKENGQIWAKAVRAGRINVKDSEFHLNYPIYERQSIRELIDRYLQSSASDDDEAIPSWQKYALSLINEDEEISSVPVMYFSGEVFPEDEFVESGEMWL